MKEITKDIKIIRNIEQYNKKRKKWKEKYKMVVIIQIVKELTLKKEWKGVEGTNVRVTKNQLEGREKYYANQQIFMKEAIQNVPSIIYSNYIEEENELKDIVKRWMMMERRRRNGIRKIAILKIGKNERRKEEKTIETKEIIEQVKIATRMHFQRSVGKNRGNWHIGSKPSQIRPYLYVGDAQQAFSRDMLKEIGATHIINCAKECENHFKDEFEYYKIRLTDTKEANIRKYIKPLMTYIDEMKERRKPAIYFVHCFAGISRSCSVAIAILKHVEHLSFEEAEKLMKEKRPEMTLNPTFVNQLK
mmetsp:Transcript_821/g.1280  ORF Transcript_821/g.1280 Transcript_821/m.1280 type:complete len:304 (+) Transcript_821:17-928(+)